MKFAPSLAVIFYALGFILTFGHAYTHHEEPPKDRLVSPKEILVGDSIICALFWPLYWSTHAYQTPKQD